ncbi:augurin-A isoform X2 [Festucalex cinctus]
MKSCKAESLPPLSLPLQMHQSRLAAAFSSPQATFRLTCKSHPAGSGNSNSGAKSPPRLSRRGCCLPAQPRARLFLSGVKMAAQLSSCKLLGFAALLIFWVLTEVSGDGKKLHKILTKRDVAAVAPPTAASSKASVAVSPSKAQEFLAKLRRTKRNIWDRSRPDVQQWIMQFMYMGYDEQRLEADLSYWMDYARSHDHGRQHHYDENAPIGPRDPNSYRHGANVNYDYY